ncbi:MAG TPA: hypothetical protein VMJ70_03000 [Candidatus Sulfotelmatobacter sp.]|nr:hypothetical protein [Candidatus Sulfotelmatobacter sp.]
MRRTRMSLPNALMNLGLLFAGILLWILHAEAWDLGRRSPVLNYDTSQYALAGRELAQHGLLDTPFALPIELGLRPGPPWPLAMIQPGMVGIDALVEKLLPNPVNREGSHYGAWARPDQREWLLLSFPFMCFVMAGVSLGIGARHLLERLAPDLSNGWHAAGGFVIGTAFLLDPEAQHFAMSPASDLPFAFGLIGAMAALVLGRAHKWPVLYGLLLGLTTSFRFAGYAIAPLLIAAAALDAPRERRVRVAIWSVVGFALPLLPWWIYKTRAFGSPIADLSRLVIWDGVRGMSGFDIYHLPELPDFPRGLAAWAPLARKVAGNLPALISGLLIGPRALWVIALPAWLAVAKPQRTQALAGVVMVAIAAISLGFAAATIPWLKNVFAARVLLEAAGTLACWGLFAHWQNAGLSPRARRVLSLLVAGIVLVWGTLQTSRGLADARRFSQERGTPGALTLLKIAVLLNQQVSKGEPVMCNLGPELAWEARRPVIHLSRRPEDMAACRRHCEFRNVLLVFRDPSRAWPGWADLVAHPLEASRDPALNITHWRRYESGDGFIVVWFELGPAEPKLAALP